MVRKTFLLSLLVGLFFFGVLTTARAAKLYVTNMSDDSVSVIVATDWRQPTTWKVGKTITVGKMPHVPAISPDGKKLLGEFAPQIALEGRPGHSLGG